MPTIQKHTSAKSKISDAKLKSRAEAKRAKRLEDLKVKLAKVK
jgi:hypothetical protein